MGQPSPSRTNVAVRSAATGPAVLVAVSLVVVAVSVGLLAWLSIATKHPTVNQPLLVYCAVSVLPALQPIADAYERETGVPVSIQAGSSGSLETQIALAGKGDVFIPAAQSPYLDRARSKGLVDQIVPLAEFQLVLAVNPRVPSADVSLDDITAGRLRCAIANEEAAAGHVTRLLVEQHGSWSAVRQAAKVFLPTVTAVAQAVQQGTAVDAGFVWNTTARQFGLTAVDLPELAAGRATVSAGVLSCSQDLPTARAFARFLADPDQGGAVFRRLGYSPPGDRSSEH